MRHFIDELKSKLSITELIGSYIQVKRYGKHNKVCCPFHQEKTPSFVIYEDDGRYHCFGCGAKGDIINFVQEYEKLDWRDAVAKLAGIAGMEMPQPERSAANRGYPHRKHNTHNGDYNNHDANIDPYEQEKQQRQRQYEIMNHAASYFTSSLYSNSGIAARNYIKQRTINQDSLQKFALGYAPPGNTLHKYLQQHNISDKEAMELGLLSQNDSGQYYDKFRERLIFPICDHKGQIIAFGGRIMRSEQQPKYLNSPETPLFHKRKTLYNLHNAKNIARKNERIIVVEGYMDVIALDEAGISESVAALGTAFSEDHLAMLWKIVPSPIICLDGDQAGQRAMSKIVFMAMENLKANYNMRFAILPAGEDTDSILHSKGKAALQQIFEPKATIGLADCWWRIRYNEHFNQITNSSANAKSDPQQKAKWLEQLKKDLATIKDPTCRKIWNDWMWQKIKNSSSNSNRNNKNISSLTSSHAPTVNKSILMMFFMLLNAPSLLEIYEEEFALVDLHATPELEQLQKAILSLWSAEIVKINNRNNEHIDNSQSTLTEIIGAEKWQAILKNHNFDQIITKILNNQLLKISGIPPTQANQMINKNHITLFGDYLKQISFKKTLIVENN